MSETHRTQAVSAMSPQLHFLAGGGEMGERTRGLCWSETAVGPIDAWPHSLKTAVSICLGSRHPMVIWWGRPAYTQFYNDGYISFLGSAKHPLYLGRSGRDCWSEIWHIVEPMVQGVYETGEATWSEDLQLVLNRNLPREEAYFTFSYGPIRADDGSIGGIFCACNETTNRVIGERRLRTLRDLNLAEAGTKTVQEACGAAAQILSENAADIPFALIYLLESGGSHARLTAATTLQAGNAAAPARIDLTAPADNLAPWPLKHVLETGRAELIGDLVRRFGSLPGGLWPESPDAALVVPIAAPGQARPMGFLVTGFSTRRVIDPDYQSFFTLVSGHIGAIITNARAHEEERRRAEALAEIDRAKTAFFSNVSHEFRTPLTLMLGPVQEAIADPSIPQAARERLQFVHRNSLRLLKLVNSLLDFARIEAGRVQACYEPTNFAAASSDLASSFQSAMERAGLGFEVECEELESEVYLDRDMWEKVVLNLLSNALKFTLQGAVRVRVYQQASQAVFEVSDTGVGIPAGELPRLFERFHRVQGSPGRTQEGTGIGLALVRELVNLHRGHIEVESDLGRGTTFRVHLQFGSTHLPPEHIKAERSQSSTAIGAQAFVEEALRWTPDSTGDTTRPPYLADGVTRGVLDPRFADTFGSHILLADDNADMRAYVSALLSPMYEVEAVADGESALQAAARRPPDLILADVMMPRIDGLLLLRKLRADPGLSRVPVILLSARAGEESRIEGLDAGADDYMVKPFMARELITRVGALLERWRSRAALFASEQQVAADLEAMTRLRAVGERCQRSGKESNECLAGILDAALFITGAPKGNLQLLEQGVLRVAVQRGFEASFLEILARVQPCEDSACGNAMLAGKRVVVEDVSSNPTVLGSSMSSGLLKGGVHAVTSIPLMSSDGEVLGILSTHFAQPHAPSQRELHLLDLLARQAGDYLERKKAERALASQHLALAAAARQKDEFLAMLAHELRNPLAPIRNANEVLAKLVRTQGKEVGSAIEVVRRQVDLLARIVDDLLDVSRVTHGRIELKCRSVNVATVIAQALETVLPLMNEKQHLVTVESPRHPSLHVCADPARLTQCLVNVLTNAAKYTDRAGEIRIRSRAHGGIAVIEISDTGMGISAALLPHIFDLFVQGDRALDRTQGGLGVGLALTKRLIQMHGGEIAARSAGVGQGAIFEIHLPLIDAATATSDSEAVPPRAALRSVPTKIMIVDDNRDSTDSLAALLKLEGHEVQTAYAAREALERAASWPPAVVLLDVGMPGMDGYELAGRLRAMTELRDTRFIFLSGYGQPEDFKRTAAAGFEHHLVKPVDFPALAAAIAGASRP